MHKSFNEFQLATELAALEHLKIELKCFTSIFDWIFFIIAGKKGNHKVSNGFKIWPDHTTDYGVS